MLIVDMPMPRFCGECELLDDDYEVCRATKQYAVVGDERPSWCPIKGELVRCGECKHWHEVDTVDGTDYGVCKRPRPIIRKHTFLNSGWYRAVDGERKDGSV